jgi:signal peptidase II
MGEEANGNVRGLLGPLSVRGWRWAAVAFILDQAHKWYMLHVVGMMEGDRIPALPFLDLVLVWNRGVSYGLFQQESLLGRLVLVTISLAAVGGLGYWLARHDHTRLAAASIGLIIGGALGNALDRLIRPGVADFFSLHAFGYSWYIFNIADVAIVAGVAGLLLEALLAGRNSAAKAPQD